MTELTIDELARQTGMTVRNIRAHQSRGLLPAPELRGRTGFYGDEHVARIELIQELQADGFSLELIRRLLDTAGGSSDEALRFARALREPFGPERPRVIEAAELAHRWQGADPGLLRRAVALGIVRPLDDGRFEEPSPRLARAGAELAELGVSAEQALEVGERVRQHADRVAATFVELFLEAVWRPFDQAGRPAEGWAGVRDALERLRPLASESLLALFQLAMRDEVERALGRELARLQGAPEPEDSDGAASGGAP
jgi:DNA-binding transcriptional MerR regulator